MVFPLCNQTVTLYRQAGEQVNRYLYRDCHLQTKAVRAQDDAGTYVRWDFLLIVPGDRQVLVGDRVVPGVGPEHISRESLQKAMTVSYAKAYIFDDRICHWEAGGKG